MCYKEEFVAGVSAVIMILLWHLTVCEVSAFLVMVRSANILTFHAELKSNYDCTGLLYMLGLL